MTTPIAGIILAKIPTHKTAFRANLEEYVRHAKTHLS